METTSKQRRPNAGQFRPGHDPRRHRFTTEECQRGFWNAIYSIIARHPDCIDRSGHHMATKFLKKRSAQCESEKNSAS